MSLSSGKPWVGVVADVKVIPPHPFHTVGDKYLRALVQAADVVPVLLPALSDLVDVRAWIKRLDGVFLPGGYSMVHPEHYDGEHIEGTLYDEARDQLSLDLIRSTLDAGKPLFGVCRGLQEMNVALGGSLHQHLHKVGPYQEHREDKTLTVAEQYADAHRITCVTGGQLQRITGVQEYRVNSLHTQGIDRLAPGVTAEAIADDGLVEAFSVDGATAFAMAVQWHPEWRVMENQPNKNLFEAFGAACRQTQLL